MLIGSNVKNEEFKKTIAEVRSDNNSDANRRIIPLLTSASYLIPAKLDPKPNTDETGKIISQGQFKINFQMITNSDKMSFFPCYTDMEEYQAAVKGDFEPVILTYEEIVPLIKNSKGKISGYIVNPYSVSLPVPAELMDKLENAKKPTIKKENISANSKVKLRTPSYMPIDMMEKAKEMFAKKPEVKKAYLQMMEKEDGDENYLVTIDMEGDEQEFFAQLAPTLREFSFGIQVALTPAGNGLGKMVVENAKPFYEREIQE